jgi:hypothetical protein
LCFSVSNSSSSPAEITIFFLLCAMSAPLIIQILNCNFIRRHI